METVLIYLGIISSFLLINTFISAICWIAVLNMGYWWQLPNMEYIMFTPIVNVIVTLIFVVMYTIKCIKERIEKKIFEIYIVLRYENPFVYGGDEIPSLIIFFANIQTFSNICKFF